MFTETSCTCVSDQHLQATPVWHRQSDNMCKCVLICLNWPLSLHAVIMAILGWCHRMRPLNPPFRPTASRDYWDQVTNLPCYTCTPSAERFVQKWRNLPSVFSPLRLVPSGTRTFHHCHNWVPISLMHLKLYFLTKMKQFRGVRSMAGSTSSGSWPGAFLAFTETLQGISVIRYQDILLLNQEPSSYRGSKRRARWLFLTHDIFRKSLTNVQPDFSLSDPVRVLCFTRHIQSVIY